MSFISRHAFPSLPSLPKTYFLGHHKTGLQKMQSLLSSIDLVIECRDYRIPITSRNPLFERALEGKERIVVYTKRDLVGQSREDKKTEELVKTWHLPATTLFVRNGKEEEGDKSRRTSISALLDVLREHAQRQWKLVGHRVMVVGTPNVGKSTLLNALRAYGIGKGKVAATGAQPGVTRKVSKSGVKIIPSEDDMDSMDESAKRKFAGVGGGVYLLDTPGVFATYVPDSDAMMKLALCGSVKDAIISPVVLADYLLYHINLHLPALYAEYAPPTNDIVELLSEIAKKTGRLGKGGRVDTEATALWMIQKWRNGYLGRFMLDDFVGGVKTYTGQDDPALVGQSFNQARKLERVKRQERNRARGETR